METQAVPISDGPNSTSLVRTCYISLVVFVVSLIAGSILFIILEAHEAKAAVSVVEIPYHLYLSFRVIAWVGMLSLLVTSFSFTFLRLITRREGQGTISYILKACLIVLVLPFYMFINVMRSRKESAVSLSAKRIFKKITRLALIVICILPIWFFAYILIGVIAFGYYMDDISISGTGSMYPTFPKGQEEDAKEQSEEIVATPGFTRYPTGVVLFGKRFFGDEVGRGDIVIVEDDKIRAANESLYGDPDSGWVKRVIALPGDTLELKGGIVYLNSEPLEEPYTARPRSTFGGKFLSECTQVTVPDNSIFIMGDNRTGSGDSREHGFIEMSAINHVLSLFEQKGVLDTKWRDTSADFDEASKITLDSKEFMRLLNEKRQEEGLSPLVYNSALEESARKRARYMLEHDISPESYSEDDSSIEEAFKGSNYPDTSTWGESYIQGYYEAADVLENALSYADSKKMLLDANFHDIGIAVVEGELNGCPTQVIMRHYAATWGLADWKRVYSELSEIQGSWAKLIASTNFYRENKTDIDRINEAIRLRMYNQSKIIARMENNQPFTVEEVRMTYQDNILQAEIATLAKRLNEKIDAE